MFHSNSIPRWLAFGAFSYTVCAASFLGAQIDIAFLGADKDGSLPSNQRMSIDFFNTMGGTTIEIGTEPSSLGGDNDPISAGYFGSIGGAASDPVMTPPGMGLPLVGIETQTTCMPAMKTVYVDPHGNQVGPNYAHAVATSVPDPNTLICDIDTAVVRLDTVTWNTSQIGESRLVDIEITALSLQSASPIPVTFGGANPQFYDVSVSLTEPSIKGRGEWTATEVDPTNKRSLAGTFQLGSQGDPVDAAFRQFNTNFFENNPQALGLPVNAIVTFVHHEPELAPPTVIVDPPPLELPPGVLHIGNPFGPVGQNFANWEWESRDGDTNHNGFTANDDLGVCFGNFNPSATDKDFTTCDVEGNGNTDNTDLGRAFGAFTGPDPSLGLIVATAASAEAFGAENTAKLIYNSETGNVSIDPRADPSGQVINFVLKNDGAHFLPDAANFPFLVPNADPPPPLVPNFTAVAESFEISQSDGSLIGFANVHDLGNILPPGLTFAEVENIFSTATYVGAAGSGVRQFSIIPEPTSSVMTVLALGALLWVGRNLTAQPRNAGCPLMCHLEPTDVLRTQTVRSIHTKGGYDENLTSSRACDGMLALRAF